MKKFAIILSGISVLTSAVASPVFADNATSAVTGKPKLDIACMQMAIATRETAIASAFTAYSSAVSSAFSARASAQASAWLKTNAKERARAIKTAWKVYRSAISSARSAWSKGRQAAWTAFYGARKSCGPSAAAEDSTTHSVDSSL